MASCGLLGYLLIVALFLAQHFLIYYFLIGYWSNVALAFLVVDVPLFLHILLNPRVRNAAVKGAVQWPVYCWTTGAKLLLLVLRVSHLARSEVNFDQQLFDGCTVAIPAMYVIWCNRARKQLFGSATQRVTVGTLMHSDMMFYVAADFVDIWDAMKIPARFTSKMEKEIGWVLQLTAASIFLCFFGHAYSFAAQGETSETSTVYLSPSEQRSYSGATHDTLIHTSSQQTQASGGGRSALTKKTEEKLGSIDAKKTPSNRSEGESVTQRAAIDPRALGGDVFSVRKSSAIISIFCVDAPLAIVRFIMIARYGVGESAMGPFLAKNIIFLLLQPFRLQQAKLAEKTYGMRLQTIHPEFSDNLFFDTYAQESEVSGVTKGVGIAVFGHEDASKSGGEEREATREARIDESPHDEGMAQGDTPTRPNDDAEWDHPMTVPSEGGDVDRDNDDYDNLSYSPAPQFGTFTPQLSDDGGRSRSNPPRAASQEVVPDGHSLPDQSSAKIRGGNLTSDSSTPPHDPQSSPSDAPALQDRSDALTPVPPSPLPPKRERRKVGNRSPLTRWDLRGARISSRTFFSQMMRSTRWSGRRFLSDLLPPFTFLSRTQWVRISLLLLLPATIQILLSLNAPQRSTPVDILNPVNWELRHISGVYWQVAIAAMSGIVFSFFLQMGMSRMRSRMLTSMFFGVRLLAWMLLFLAIRDNTHFTIQGLGNVDFLTGEQENDSAQLTAAEISNTTLALEGGTENDEGLLTKEVQTRILPEAANNQLHNIAMRFWAIPPAIHIVQTLYHTWRLMLDQPVVVLPPSTTNVTPMTGGDPKHQQGDRPREGRRGRSRAKHSSLSNERSSHGHITEAPRYILSSSSALVYLATRYMVIPPECSADLLRYDDLIQGTRLSDALFWHGWSSLVIVLMIYSISLYAECDAVRLGFYIAHLCFVLWYQISAQTHRVLALRKRELMRMYKNVSILTGALADDSEERWQYNSVTPGERIERSTTLKSRMAVMAIIHRQLHGFVPRQLFPPSV